MTRREAERQMQAEALNEMEQRKRKALGDAENAIDKSRDAERGKRLAQGRKTPKAAQDAAKAFLNGYS